MFKNIKKVELHLHLDGSVRVKTAEELLKKNNLYEKMTVVKDTTDLTDYLTKFDIPISLMQTKENLTRISHELVEDLIDDNVIYAEVRFAPNFHTKNGLSIDEVVKAVLEGLKSNKIKTNLILCMMRGHDFLDNKKVIDTAKNFINKGVCAIDLAGDEIKYKTSLYNDLFIYAKKLDVPFTIHAGEAGDISNIMDAIKLGTKRIGHGIKAINNPEILKLIKENNITLEICPTSNLQTHAIDNYKNHPIQYFYKNNILVTVNTDNNTVSNINLSKEYELLNKYFAYNLDDFKMFNINAINASFLSDLEKSQLKEKINN